ncbi:hypothetical protein RB213_003103 [Colletotrichum asianum]
MSPIRRALTCGGIPEDHFGRRSDTTLTHASTRTHIAADAAAIIVVTFPHCGTHPIHTPASPAGIKRHVILLTVKAFARNTYDKRRPNDRQTASLDRQPT